MRTTLTLDDDVAALLEQVRKSKGLGFKEAVNQGLREGLQQMVKPDLPRKRYKTKPVSVGKILAPQVADVHELLEYLEGPGYR